MANTTSGYIATEAQAVSIGGKGSPTNNKFCTALSAMVSLGCNVSTTNGAYQTASPYQLVCYSDLSAAVSVTYYLSQYSIPISTITGSSSTGYTDRTNNQYLISFSSLPSVGGYLNLIMTSYKNDGSNKQTTTIAHNNSNVGEAKTLNYVSTSSFVSALYVSSSVGSDNRYQFSTNTGTTSKEIKISVDQTGGKTFSYVFNQRVQLLLKTNPSIITTGYSYTPNSSNSSLINTNSPVAKFYFPKSVLQNAQTTYAYSYFIGGYISRVKSANNYVRSSLAPTGTGFSNSGGLCQLCVSDSTQLAPTSKYYICAYIGGSVESNSIPGDWGSNRLCIWIKFYCSFSANTIIQSNLTYGYLTSSEMVNNISSYNQGTFSTAYS